MSKDDSNLYISGKVLLATPHMSDPRFHKAVILICGHDEKGAMGLVINNTIVDVGFADLLKELNVTQDEHDLKNLPALQILDGGPVEKGKGFLLHSADYKRPESVIVSDEYVLTGTLEALNDVANKQGPEKLLFILGYASWTAGQLEDELKQNVWFVLETDSPYIFDVPPEKKWVRAIENLGFNPVHLSAQLGSA